MDGEAIMNMVNGKSEARLFPIMLFVTKWINNRTDSWVHVDTAAPMCHQLSPSHFHLVGEKFALNEFDANSFTLYFGIALVHGQGWKLAGETTIVFEVSVAVDKEYSPLWIRMFHRVSTYSHELCKAPRVVAELCVCREGNTITANEQANKANEKAGVFKLAAMHF